MIDTIMTRFNEIPLRRGLVADPDQFCELNGLDGWEYDLGKPHNSQGSACRRFRILVPLRDGPCLRKLTIFGHAQVIDGYKVSLPAVIYDSNIHLIQSQAEIDRAMHRVELLINRVASYNPADADSCFTRVDLALQFYPPEVPPRAFFSSLRNSRHPLVRGEQVQYCIAEHPSGFTLKGAETTIRAYDKVLKHTGRPGEVTRIELELRRGVLQRLMGNADGGYPNRLSFDRCYQVYREQLLQFEPVRRLTCSDDFRGIKDYASLLAAHCENQGVLLPDGSRPVEFYRRVFSGPAFIDFRRRVAAAQLSLNEISFAELLPEHWPAQHLVPNAEEGSSS